LTLTLRDAQGMSSCKGSHNWRTGRTRQTTEHGVVGLTVGVHCQWDRIITRTHVGYV